MRQSLPNHRVFVTDNAARLSADVGYSGIKYRFNFFAGSNIFLAKGNDAGIVFKPDNPKTVLALGDNFNANKRYDIICANDANTDNALIR